MDIARRRFFSLGGRPSSGPGTPTPAAKDTAGATPFRPPWALPEAAFLNQCTRCGDCRRACPTGLLQADPDGYPIADFYPGHAPAGCTFCSDCVTACPSQALVRTVDTRPWSFSLAIGEDCLARQNIVCRTCGERCEAGALRFPPRLGGVAHPVLDAERCTGCAACLADCPTHALSIIHSPCSPSGVSA